MKYSVGQKVRIKSIDWYNENKNEFGDVKCSLNCSLTKSMSIHCGSIQTIESVVDGGMYWMKENPFNWADEMIEGLVEEETPKFQVNDIVFVKNIGWVRITNSYWDSLANEYIYEAIGFNGKGEYDNINQSNIECQMLPESENPHTCGNKITLDEYKNNDKEWLFNKLATLDNITALESIQDIFNHLQQSKYPKTYEECYQVTGLLKTSDIYGYKNGLLFEFQKLLIARDAYWKLYGEEMGLGKPWKPDWNAKDNHFYTIHTFNGKIECSATAHRNAVLIFPTEEMRDAFYENFKELIEECKELL